MYRNNSMDYNNRMMKLSKESMMLSYCNNCVFFRNKACSFKLGQSYIVDRFINGLTSMCAAYNIDRSFYAPSPSDGEASDERQAAENAVLYLKL